MKTGISKKDKTTAIYFNESEKWIEVQTYNTDLKKRLSSYAVQYPEHCQVIDDNEMGELIFRYIQLLCENTLVVDSLIEQINKIAVGEDVFDLGRK